MVKSLGLRKINQSIIRDEEPGLMGLIQKIGFMLKVEEL